MWQILWTFKDYLIQIEKRLLLHQRLLQNFTRNQIGHSFCVLAKCESSMKLQECGWIAFDCHWWQKVQKLAYVTNISRNQLQFNQEPHNLPYRELKILNEPMRGKNLSHKTIFESNVCILSTAMSMNKRRKDQLDPKRDKTVHKWIKL